MDATPQCVPAHSLIGGAENMKLLFDSTMALIQQLTADSQANSRAWNDLALRRAHNNEAFDNYVKFSAAVTQQTGEALDQQNLSPESQATAEDIASKGDTANRAVDVAAAGQAVNADAVNAAVSDAITASIPILTTAIGEAIAAALKAGAPTA